MLSYNATALIVLTYLFVKKGDEVWMVVLSSLLGFIEFILHLVEGVTSYQMFSGAGLSVLYSPGFTTAAVCMLPLSIMGVIHQIKLRKLTWKVFAKGFAATAIFAYSVIMLPNIVFNNSPYPFPDNGFYELFLK